MAARDFFRAVQVGQLGSIRGSLGYSDLHAATESHLSPLALDDPLRHYDRILLDQVVQRGARDAEQFSRS